MTSMDILPPLRQDIDILPVRQGEASFLLVRDPLGISEEGLALRADIAQLFPFFDGMTPVTDLQLALVQEAGGALVSSEKIGELVDQLDRIGLLQTERYCRARDEIVQDFSRRRVREAALAGSAYPSDPVKLVEEIDALLSLPGPLPSETAGRAAPSAVVAPHIDFRVSGTSYGSAYRPLRSLSPSRILLLGTGHSLESPYSLTEKTFRTPLGNIASDREAVSQLREAGGAAVAREDFAHRSEHSIEFQLLFLQRILPMERIPVVPVLCGSLESFLLTGKNPLENPEVARFIGELKRWHAGPPAGKLVVAGVDLSHVGPKFGDDTPAKRLEEEFKAEDRRLLDAMERGDGEAFYRSVLSTGNRFKVCGFSALWTLLTLLPGTAGEVLDYRIWHEEGTSSAVSFASVLFRGPET